MTPAAGQWWWATAEPDPDPMPVSLDRPDPRTPGAWWSYVAGCDYAVSVTPLEPVVPYVPAATPERDPRYDPRPGDTYRTDRPYAGGVVYTVEARRGDLLVIRTPGGDRAERSVAWWSKGVCTAAWSAAALDARD